MDNSERFVEDITGYIAEIEEPGIPVVSTSHLTLRKLCILYQSERVYTFLDWYFDRKKNGYDPVADHGELGHNKLEQMI